jgi:hypothetical protein
MIKILSGYGNPGGSTIANILLCNALNKAGYECTMYAPHPWFLDKCKSGHLNEANLNENDTAIIHFLNPQNPPQKVKRAILTCHEKMLFPINRTNYKIYNYIHYVSEPQRLWHNVNHPYFVLPNLVDELKPSPNKPEKVAGIIGTIDVNKQTHIAIMKAIQSGFKTIYIYGGISDPAYYKFYVEPLMKRFKKFIQYKGMENDKQKMYDSVSDVFLSSKSETYGYIPKECKLTGTKFWGNGITDNNFTIEMTNEQILQEWIKYLEV